MRLSLFLFGLRSIHYGPLVQRAESLGFEAIWIADHLITPVAVRSRNPYNPNGGLGFEEASPLSDPWVVIGHLSSLTTTIQLGTGVYILPLRNPFVTARAVATAQNLSRGRVLLGVGSGWLAEEFAAVGQPFESRGLLMDEALDVLQKLWSGQEVNHDGKLLRFDSVRFSDPPAVPVPVIFGGITSVALRRAAACGDGWFGPSCSLETSLAARAEIESLRREVGRTADFRYFIRLDGPVVAANLRKHEEAGIQNLVMSLYRPGADREADHPAEHLEALERIAEAVSDGR